MSERIYREYKVNVTDAIRKTVSQLVDHEQDWGSKKKHPAHWYRSETAKILKLEDSDNPSLRTYEDLIRDAKENLKVQNPVDKPWNTALLNKETLNPDIIPWIINVQYHRKKFLAKPLTIREIKWFTRIFGYRTFFKPLPEIQDDPDLKSFFISNMLATWAQIYAEREKIDDIAGIKESDNSDLDMAIVDNDFFMIREYSDEQLRDQIHAAKGNRAQLTERQWARIRETWLSPSLRHQILVYESRILHHSLGDPDMSPDYLRAYNAVLWQRQYGVDDEDWKGTYQQKIDEIIRVRKSILEETEDNIKLLISLYPHVKFWWERYGESKKEK